MKTQKYAVNQYLIESMLAKVREGVIAIPEIQRPFVWDATQVRDLLDSLYQGFPVGYLIAWRNPDVRLKDGSLSAGKLILIDGQQRVTALTAAILGQPVGNKDYRKVRITIAFHPLEERFEVSNPAIAKDTAWIRDVAPLVSGEVDLFDAVGPLPRADPVFFGPSLTDAAPAEQCAAPADAGAANRARRGSGLRDTASQTSEANTPASFIHLCRTA
jgi:hypothetical protein